MAQEITDLNAVSSLTLAYIGDSVYELILRQAAVMRYNGNVNEINHYAKQFSNAQAQAVIAGLLLEDMTDEELHVFKRGRNAKSVSAPRTCSISEYRRATGLEALCGYLFLCGRESRAKELVLGGIAKYENNKLTQDGASAGME